MPVPLVGVSAPRPTSSPIRPPKPCGAIDRPGSPKRALSSRASSPPTKTWGASHSRILHASPELRRAKDKVRRARRQENKDSRRSGRSAVVWRRRPAPLARDQLAHARVARRSTLPGLGRFLHSRHSARACAVAQAPDRGCLSRSTVDPGVAWDNSDRRECPKVLRLGQPRSFKSRVPAEFRECTPARKHRSAHARDSSESYIANRAIFYRAEGKKGAKKGQPGMGWLAVGSVPSHGLPLLSYSRQETHRAAQRGRPCVNSRLQPLDES